MTNNKRAELSVDEADERQQLVWKVALVFLCLGMFALVIRSGAEPRCSGTDPAARTTCATNVGDQTLHPPVKGGLAFGSDAGEERDN
jgi:hypothetical protein